MDWWNLLIWIVCGYAILSTVVAAIRWMTSVDYQLTDSQKREASRHKFAVIGCGVSGLAVGYYFRMMGLNFTIIERGSGIGGTWFWNTYPGIGCDVTSHLYSFSNYLNSNWSTKFPYGKEINNYLIRFWHYASLEKYTQLNSEVTKAFWNDKTNRWELTTLSDGVETHEEFNWLISCVGGLHRPNWIEIKGSDTFKGKRVHTAEWPEKVDFSGKRIGLIGTGASAVQVLPELIKSDCKGVVHFQRTPVYCMMRNQSYCWRPFQLLLSVYPFGIIFRWFRYIGAESLFPMWRYYNGPLNRLAKWFYKWNVRRVINDKDVAEKVIPTYALGCKRIVISDHYYQSMNDARYQLETDGIVSFSQTGLETKKAHHELDLIIYATGFSLASNYDFVLNHNEKFSEWRDQGLVRTYYGTFIAQVPNYITLLGPMTGLGHNSIIFMIECQIQILINALRHMFDRKAECVTVKDSIIEEVMSEWEERIDKSVWSPKNCNSWYQQGEPNGRPWGIWPGTTTEYYLRTRNLPSSHFEYN